MSRNVKAALTALKKAVSKNKKSSSSVSLVNEISSLVTKVDPGDALDANLADKLVAMFGERMNTLYSLAPRETIRLSISYFSSLETHLVSTEPSPSWQKVAGKGILAGLQEYLDDDGDATPFTHPFLTTLCKVLTVDSSEKLTTDMRHSIGRFVSDLLSNHQQAKKWIMESKTLGVTGLAKLIRTETSFRVLDTYFEIAARVTPKRNDPQTRQTFLLGLFNTASTKARLGENICKSIMKIMDETRKNAWFAISDQLFEVLGENPKRPQRFVLGYLSVCGHDYFSEKAALRLFLDLEITLNINPNAEEGVEEMVTIPFSNLKGIVIEAQENNATRVTFELESLPTWQNPTERKTQSSTLSINCQISSDEAKRLREVLEKKGLAGKLSGHDATQKQSYSRQDMKLDHIGEVHNTFRFDDYLRSDITYSETEPSTGQSERKRLAAAVGKEDGNVIRQKETHQEYPAVKSTELSKTSPSLAIHKITSPETKSDSKSASVKRGVIIDSDEDEPMLSSVLKRKSSPLTDYEDVFPPSAKKKRTADVLATTLMTPLKATRIDQSFDTETVSVSSSFKLPVQNPRNGPSLQQPKLTVGSKQALVQPQLPSHTRIKGMKAMNGKAAAPAAPRQRGAIESKIKDSIQETKNNSHTVKEKELLEMDKDSEEATIFIEQPVSSSIKSKSKPKPPVAKPTKAIWEAEDFSQQTRGAKARSSPLEPALSQQNTPMKVAVSRLSTPTPARDTRTVVLGENSLIFEAQELDTFPEMEVLVELPEPAQPLALAEELGFAGDPSSPIRPDMITKRKLRDATILALSKSQAAESTSKEVAKALPKPAPSPVIDSKAEFKVHTKPLNNARALAEAKAKWKAAAVKKDQNLINTYDTHGVASVEHGRAGDNRVIRGGEKVKKLPLEVFQKGLHLRKRKSTSSVDSDGMEDDMEEEKAPKTEVDAIAEVITKIQDKLIDNIKFKVTTVRGEVRVARTNLLEAAVADLEEMQGNLDHSFSRFMQLEEAYGQVSQGVLAGLEELQATNDNIATMLSDIIQEHDRITSATRAYKTPFADPLPACLTL